jgi:hypothetical protein
LDKQPIDHHGKSFQCKRRLSVFFEEIFFAVAGGFAQWAACSNLDQTDVDGKEM